MAKPSRKGQRDRADRAFSRFIRARDGACRACGSTEFLQCAHVWSRRYHSTRWDERNAVALCRGCHTKFTHNPALWDEWCEQNIHDYRELRGKAIELPAVPLDYVEIARIYREGTA